MVTRPMMCGMGTPRLTFIRTRSQIYTLAALAVLAFIVPFTGNDYFLAIAIKTMFFAILAVGWNIIAGYGGMMSFGQAAFCGVGAYASTILGTRYGVSPWIGMLVGTRKNP